ncbi:2-hydroxychromene-2-carboxylate isomerase [Minwuia sp.]|uniref:2-hydroxychromene-2-carboxylate isomerase n=1 Tax=Minwuia sp. TaxID=2493630 RepID=UPI003A9198C7
MDIDYYCALTSPWSYLGHARLGKIAADAGATIRIMPVNALTVFDRTGGLPLPKRSPERQAYRMQEIKRWPARLGIPLNPQPAFFPTDETQAALIVIAARESGKDAFGLAGRFMRAVWAEERNIADTATIAAIVGEAGLDHGALARKAEEIDAAAIRDQHGEQAVAEGVFGVPSYKIGDQLFWGQDRLSFVEDALS